MDFNMESAALIFDCPVDGNGTVEIQHKISHWKKMRYVI